MTKTTRVLIVDDSAVVRQVLNSMLGADPDIEVVGTAQDPIDARDKIKSLTPDVLTLDIEMPKIDGITFLKNLMRLRPMPVVMISTLTEKGAAITLDALSIGAVDYVTKPQGAGLQAELEKYSTEIRDKVKAAGSAKVSALERRAQPTPESEIESTRRALESRLEGLGPAASSVVVAIGASTGGTEAIKEVVTRLPRNFPPVVVVQHIPAAFSLSYSKRLDSLCELSVKEAENGDVLRPGHAYIAPGSHHLYLHKSGSKVTCRLSDADPVNKHRPAVDVLFDSVVEVIGKRSVGVILTGMGADGARGLLAMRNKGSITMAQNEETCVVYGMPRAAAELGAAEHVFPLLDIPAKLVVAVRKKVTTRSTTR